MANTTTGSLADSQQLIIDSSRVVREYVGVFTKTCDVQTLEPGTGLTWEEISLSQLNSQTVSETDDITDNAQEITDALFSVTPVIRGITVIVTDRVYQRMPKSVIAKMGPLAQNAMQRGKDEAYLAVFAGATNTLGGTGTSGATGTIRSAARRITSNVTEGALGKICTVHHGFVIKDYEDEIIAGVGTYPIPAGLTQEVFRNGFRGTCAGTEVYEDGNIAINATPDARGAVHAKEAIVMVQGHAIRTKTERREGLGGGAEQLFIYDEEAFGERSAGNWMYGLLNDATAPS